MQIHEASRGDDAIVGPGGASGCASLWQRAGRPGGIESTLRRAGRTRLPAKDDICVGGRGCSNEGEDGSGAAHIHLKGRIIFSPAI